MLETVVSEKSVARKPLSPKPTIASANERLKGLLSRRDSTNYSADKALSASTPPLPASSPANGTLPIGGLIGDNFVGTPSLETPVKSRYLSTKKGNKIMGRTLVFGDTGAVAGIYFLSVSFAR